MKAGGDEMKRKRKGEDGGERGEEVQKEKSVS